MNEILGIQIPGDLSALDPDALKALGRDLSAAIRTAYAADDGVTVEALGEIKAAKAVLVNLKTLKEEKAAANATFADEVEAEVADLDDLEAAFEDEPEGDEDEDGDKPEGDEPEAGADEDADTKASEKPGLVAAPYKPTVGKLKGDTPADTPAGETGESGQGKGFQFRAASGVRNTEAGELFGDDVTLASALIDRWKDIRGGSTEKFTVANYQIPFTEKQTLSRQPDENIAKFAEYDPNAENHGGLTAAICAAREIMWDTVAGVPSSTARPFLGSLPTYNPPRLGVSLYPPVLLADMTDNEPNPGYGTWTRADDADDEAEKLCTVLPCGDLENYDAWAIWRCITISNMEAMSFPELVAAALNKLQAAQHRMAEISLLNAALASPHVRSVETESNDFATSINLFEQITRLAALYREEERIGDQTFDVWLPRWVIPALQVDLLRMRRTSGRFQDRFASEAEIRTAFRTVGVDPTFVMDNATAWPDVPALVDGDPIPDFPTDIPWLLSPKGNIRALRRPDLNLGVTNAPNTVRNDTEIKTNRFTMFWESFEGILDFGAASYSGVLSGVTLNGAQTADVTAITQAEGS